VKVLYTAEATVTGGREEGRARTSDGALDVELRTPAELGGPGGGTNPEQLFAAGYAACFESALKTVARRRDANADDVSIASKVSLGPRDDRSYGLAVALVRAAHQVCPYSNATRGNVDVALTVNGESVEA
jgi:osmotically inducible protein OsmC